MKIREFLLYCPSYSVTASQMAYARYLECEGGSKNPKWRGGVPSVARKRRYIARHPERHLAHKLMTNAIRRGELIRMPCEKCGAIKVEGHHENYTQPLIVKWLCKRHHLAAHRPDIKLRSPHESFGV